MFGRTIMGIKLVCGIMKAPPHWYKERKVKKYSKKYGCNIFFETGTYKGDMDFALKNEFDWIGTIEIVPELHFKAKERLKEYSNIHFYLGDSSTELRKMISDARDDSEYFNPIFFLDGHYSKGETGKGEYDTPIMAELDSIVESEIKSGVILIDDARCFIHSGEFIDYPTLGTLRTEIIRRWPDSNFSVRNDIIRIVLKN